MNASETAVLIPSLEPDERLPRYVRELAESGFGRVIVVNDGSSAAYQPFFDEVAGIERCEVLVHEKNQGKGAALKTGFARIAELPEILGVVTADSDGQHTARDAVRMADALQSGREELVLGSRSFKQDNVPWKSRWGNRTTTIMFSLLYGHWLPDTQTGLRGFAADMLPLMREIPGARFEYEMNMLIHCAGRHVPMRVLPIETVYHDENKSSHFRPFHDAVRIYRILLGNFFRFASSSAVATLLDLSLYTVLEKWLLPVSFSAPVTLFGMTFAPRIAAATAIARVLSASVNFAINKKFVFNIRKSRGALLRYALLCVAVLAASAALTTLLSDVLGLGSLIAKCVVDAGLFLVNFRIQKAWVFRKDDETL